MLTDTYSFYNMNCLYYWRTYHFRQGGKCGTNMTGAQLTVQDALQHVWKIHFQIVGLDVEGLSNGRLVPQIWHRYTFSGGESWRTLSTGMCQQLQRICNTALLRPVGTFPTRCYILCNDLCVGASLPVSQLTATTLNTHFDRFSLLTQWFFDILSWSFSLCCNTVKYMVLTMSTVFFLPLTRSVFILSNGFRHLILVHAVVLTVKWATC